MIVLYRPPRVCVRAPHVRAVCHLRACSMNGLRTYNETCAPEPPTYCDAINKAAFVLLPM